MWHRTGVYYIPKLIFSHNFPVKVGDAYYVRVSIVFEFLRVMTIAHALVVVISHLDVLKKENAGAREAIRWLEAEFHKGNRYVDQYAATCTV